MIGSIFKLLADAARYEPNMSERFASAEYNFVVRRGFLAQDGEVSEAAEEVDLIAMRRMTRLAIE